MVFSRTAVHWGPAGAPGAPTNVTSITKDAGATVSFLAPVSIGSGAVTSYTVTPYIGGAAQSPTTVTAGSAGSITGSNGSTYVQVPVTGLTNSTAYTFSAHASNAAGAGPESAQSGANTPLASLVFGDDFNGPAGGPIDPEWWVYTRCGYLAQNEVEYYLPSQVALDGSGNLTLTAHKQSYTGPGYPSAGGGTVTQPWRSGAVQSNTRTYAPSPVTGTMTFQVSWRTCPDIGGGMWPSPWLEGYHYLSAWKTDPQQAGWDNSGQAELDIAEWNPTQVFTPDSYQVNSYGSTQVFTPVNTSTDLSLAQHVYSVQWKPGTSNTFFRDGVQVHQDTGSSVADSTGSFFLLLYLQIISGSATADNTCYIDYYRVFNAAV